jgi:hypothetical protein
MRWKPLGSAMMCHLATAELGPAAIKRTPDSLGPLAIPAAE